jgi:transposase
MMSARRKNTCPNCKRLRQQVRALQAQVQALQETVRLLQGELARLRKDSSNSSKPPSSDLVKHPKPAPPPGQAQRAPGGQPGHPHHQRPLLPPELLTDGAHEHRLDHCPACGHALEASQAAPRVVQQIDVVQPPLTSVEHRALPGWCPHCQKLHYAPLPDAIQRGQLVGPRLTALIAFLKGACHASYSTIRKFLRDVAGVTVSRGQLAKVIAKVSQALAAPYQELLDRLPSEARLNVDETGHHDRGELWWTWCFRAGLYTLFKIEPTRGSAVLLDVLGKDFDGVLGCDYFSAYRRYMRDCDVVVQFCLAHLIRDVKYLTTLPDGRDRAYGERLREALRALFGVIHRRAEMGPRVFQRQLAAARDEVLRQAAADVPPTAPSRNLAQRFARHGQAYCEFVTTPGVEPTNNLAEQAIRFVVIDRHITQGTRGETGRGWCERIWTVLATCAQQGRSAFAYLHGVVTAYFEQTAVPSLLSEVS